jgi:hypothetical protein
MRGVQLYASVGVNKVENAVHTAELVINYWSVLLEIIWARLDELFLAVL